MRVVHTRTRWLFCFLVLPVLWIVGSLATDFQAVLMLPAAIAAAVISALTAYRSGGGVLRAAGYFMGTGAVLVVAFWIAVASLFAIYCSDGYTGGAC